MRLPDLRFTICDLRRSHSGVALIVTVIMLAVITFLAVAFLALSGREKNAVKGTTDQTTARLAADAALVRAQNDLLAGILASGNLANFNLLVSTTYANPYGFDTSLPANSSGQLTNVNYYLPNGNPLTGNNALQNLANLFFSPAPPVFVTNRFFPNSNEFRSYIDLNRDGRLNLSGFWGVTNHLNQAILDNSNRFVTNYLVGDPQWIGGTERIEFPHSASNKFVYRLAYAAVPVGKTLDLNAIHNNAKDAGVNSFLRNQGVGAWEINLAAFLRDLNTNYWTYLQYFTNTASPPNSGTAFDDAYTLWNWRRGGRTLDSVQALYGAAGVNAFQNDWFDGYSAGAVKDTLNSYLSDPDGARTSSPWSGADMVNHFFSIQDLFNPAKTQMPFYTRLMQASTNVSTYDQYTYYRLLSQLGTDSAPDDSQKLHLNYKNVDGYSATNFVPWTALDFFTNAANRLLSEYTQDWLDADYNYYTNFFGTNQAFGLSSIPVLISNRFVYTPSVHRLLQVAANIADTRTNTQLPSVFRPLFRRDDIGLYIIGYEAVPTNNPNAYLTIPWRPELVPTNTAPDINVYGVPWIVGAKQGLPNFNEVAMHSLFELTRKLQIVRPSRTAPKSSWRTNIMYVAAISNAFGIEAWNSYRNDFTNPIVIRASGELTMTLTNETGILLNRTFTSELLANTNLTVWRGYGNGVQPQASSFVTFRTNIPFLPESAYSSITRSFTTNLNQGFEAVGNFPPLQWGLVTRARLRVVMQLGDANGPIIDYVQLDGLDNQRDLTDEIRDPDVAGFEGLWSTNRVNATSVLPLGVQNQLNISLGMYGTDTTKWKDYGRLPPGNVSSEVENFKALFGLSPLVNTNLVQQVPFSPTRRVLREYSWQANDPLVHYMANDLVDIARTNDLQKPLLSQPLQLLKNIGVLNTRYSPWGGNPQKRFGDAEGDPNAYDPAFKDPLVMRSDDWQFPTNALPGVGWLGRMHRGTPWQTVYMKASDLNISEFSAPLTNLNAWLNSYSRPAVRWAEWSGNLNFADAFFTRPATDRRLFDVFTTAINENASRGRLSVNQTNLAAWSAVFGGVVALTNSLSPDLMSEIGRPAYSPLVIEPAGVYDPFGANPPAMVRLVSGINAERSRKFASGNVSDFLHPGGWFKSAGDILSVPALSVGAPVFVPDDPTAPLPQEGTYYWTNSSPFISFGATGGVRGRSDQVPALDSNEIKYSINDAALEWLPQQIMSLVRLGEPRFLIYAYGQALRPAENSIITAGGPFFGLCTNYQITAEVAARAVVRVEGSANPADANNANPKRRYPPRLIIESYNYLPPD